MVRMIVIDLEKEALIEEVEGSEIVLSVGVVALGPVVEGGDGGA